MDPFSITIGSITLVTLASKVCVELKKLRNDCGEASSNVNAMLADLKGFKTVLESIQESFEDLDSRAPLTGFIGAHWTALRTTLGDGCDSLGRLNTLLDQVNKEARFLDSARRALRWREATDQIIFFRQEIQAYNDALQLSLQAVTFFQQTTIKEDTVKILDGSETLQKDLHRLATNLDFKLTALEILLKDKNRPSGTASVSHLQACVKTASTVVASASTVLSQDVPEENWDVSSETSGWYQSSASPPNEILLNWVVSQSSSQSSQHPQSPGGPNRHSYQASPSSPTSLMPPMSPDYGRRPPSRELEPLPRPSPASSPRDEVNQNVVFDDIIPQTKPNNVQIEKKRLGFSLARLLSSQQKRDTPPRRKLLEPNGLQREKLKILPDGSVSIRFCFVGDGACGKTCFCVVSTNKPLPEIFIPTVFENYLCNHEVDGVRFEAQLWDTAGQEDYDRLRPLSYPGTDVFCICFPIDSPDALDNVRAKWIVEVEHFNQKKAPIFLLGLKKDRRDDRAAINELARCNQQPVSWQEGEEMARYIGAVKYMECSALTRNGIDEIFPTMLQMILDNSPVLRERYLEGPSPRRGLKKIFWRF